MLIDDMTNCLWDFGSLESRHRRHGPRDGDECFACRHQDDRLEPQLSCVSRSRRSFEQVRSRVTPSSTRLASAPSGSARSGLKLVNNTWVAFAAEAAASSVALARRLGL